MRNAGYVRLKSRNGTGTESGTESGTEFGQNRSGIRAKSARNPDLVGEDFVDLCLAGQTALAGDEAGDRQRLDQFRDRAGAYK